PTVCVYVYCELLTLVMFVAARVLAPLIAICMTGESAIASLLNVAVIRSKVPCFTAPVGEYVIAAVGGVLSTVNVPLVGVEATTLPARSVPTLIDTVAVPFPAPTVC